MDIHIKKDYLDMFEDKYLDKEKIYEQRAISKSQLLKDLTHNEVLSRIDTRYKNIIENINCEDLELSIDSKDGAIVLDVKDTKGSKDMEFKYKKEISLFLESLCPWRKGPFKVLTTFIDAEWKSNLKWDRIEPFLSDVEGKRILDLGCNNGYFMFRLLQKRPSLVIGVDTFSKNLYSFNFFEYFIKNKILFFELFSAEYTKYYHNFFNTVLCLGLLYHLKDPISLLHSIHNSLVKGGKVILECQGIDGDSSIALCPDGRYNGCSGIWYLPTRACLISWLKRADFKDIRCFYDEPLTENEQRSTEWAKVKSFSDFFDKNTEKTVEGYPRARRIYLIAKK